MKELIQSQQHHNLISPLNISFKRIDPKKDSRIDKKRDSHKVNWYDDLFVITIISYVSAILVGTVAYFYIDGKVYFP